jgi:glycosyltransferase involved in cell wall biosynthesis
MGARLAVIPDFAEEGWPSMDLAAEMLLREASGVEASRVCPPFRRRLMRVPVLGRKRFAYNADRLLNRHLDLPRFLRRRAADFDLFHVVDHTYAQVVHALPQGRAGVFCHDLDAFGCLLDPARDPRPSWFRALARRTLKGMQAAAVVFYSTASVRGQIERHGLIDPARLVAAPYGVSPEFTAEPSSPPENAGPYLLHVGTCIPRKRMDVLLDVFAAARAQRPDLTLVKVGGEWSPEQEGRIDRLGLRGAIQHRVNLARADVARYYRGAALVLLPSEAEGFGLPVIEALACGAAVVASDLPVLREVGGDAVVYRPVGDVAAWAEAVCGLLAHPERAPGREVRLQRAARYTWAAHAATIVNAYHRLAGHA